MRLRRKRPKRSLRGPSSVKGLPPEEARYTSLRSRFIPMNTGLFQKFMCYQSINKIFWLQ